MRILAAAEGLLLGSACAYEGWDFRLDFLVLLTKLVGEH
jgi:hypothetical protein